jgi:hypothetical protein
MIPRTLLAFTLACACARAPVASRTAAASCAQRTIGTAPSKDDRCPSLLSSSELGRIICDAPFLEREARAFEPVGAPARASFTLAVAELLARGATASDLAALGLEVRPVDEGGERFVVVRERGPCPRGAGTYVFRPASPWNVVVEVPHVGFEQETVSEGFALLLAGARALFLSGSDRCASLETSACRSSDGGVSGPPPGYRLSDVAAFPETFFQAAHEATLVGSRPVVLSLHGKDPAGREEPTVMVSDGTKAEAPPGSASRRLAAALAQRGVAAVSCQAPGAHVRLCGTVSVQGRRSNGADACSPAGAEVSGLFLHVEQDYFRIAFELTRPLVESVAEVLGR